jgi:hypothetical protein
LMSYFPMFIATLSLRTSIFNGYINTRFLDFIQRNTGRVEYLRTCKEIIDAYFQVKVRAGVINANAARQGASGADGRAMASDEVDGASAVNKFAALGTYLELAGRRSPQAILGFDGGTGKNHDQCQTHASGRIQRVVRDRRSVVFETQRRLREIGKRWDVTPVKYGDGCGPRFGPGFRLRSVRSSLSRLSASRSFTARFIPASNWHANCPSFCSGASAGSGRGSLYSNGCCASS